MNHQLLSLAFFLAALLVLIGITECLYRYMKLPAEQSRKFLHVSGGLLCLLFPSFFSSHWWLLVLAALSFLLLLVTYRNKWLQSVHKTRRRSVGSVIFPVPVYVCFLVADLAHNTLFYYLPVTLLTISDTAAETAGNKWGHLGKQFFNGQKTLVGTIAFFITAIMVCAAWLYYSHFEGIAIISAAIGIAAVTAATELVTLRGWDNLTVPVVADLALWLYLQIEINIQ